MLIKSQSEVRLHTGRSVHFHPSRCARPSFLIFRRSGSETRNKATIFPFICWLYSHACMHATPLQNTNNETMKAGRACMDPLCKQIKDRKVAGKLNLFLFFVWAMGETGNEARVQAYAQEFRTSKGAGNLLHS